MQEMVANGMTEMEAWNLSSVKLVKLARVSILPKINFSVDKT